MGILLLFHVYMVALILPCLCYAHALVTFVCFVMLFCVLKLRKTHNVWVKRVSYLMETNAINFKYPFSAGCILCTYTFWTLCRNSPHISHAVERLSHIKFNKTRHPNIHYRNSADWWL